MGIYKKIKLQNSILESNLLAYYSYLELIIKTSIGLISYEEYSKALTPFMRDNEQLKWYLRLEEAKKEFQNSPDEKAEHFKKVCSEISALNDENKYLKLFSKCELTFCNGWLMNQDIYQTINFINLLDSFNEKVDFDLRLSMAVELNNRVQAWFLEVNNIREEIKKYKHIFLIAYFDYIYSKVMYEFYALTNTIHVRVKSFNLIPPDSISAFERILSICNFSLNIFQQMGHKYNVCACLFTKYDLLVSMEKHNEADAVLNELKNYYNLYEFPEVIKNITRLEEEGTYHQGLQRIVDQKNELIKIQENLSKEIYVLAKEEKKILSSIEKKSTDKIFHLHPFLHFRVPVDKLNTFYEILGINLNTTLIEQLNKFSSDSIIPILDITSEIIHKEGYNIPPNHSLEGSIRAFNIRIKLYKAGIYLSEA